MISIKGKEYLEVKDLVDILCLDESTIRRRLKLGKMPGFKHYVKGGDKRGKWLVSAHYYNRGGDVLKEAKMKDEDRLYSAVGHIELDLRFMRSYITDMGLQLMSIKTELGIK